MAINNPPIDNMKLIVDTLTAANLQVSTVDIKENPARPSAHVQQTDSKVKLYNQGTEVELMNTYLITLFLDRKYVTSITGQLLLLELFGEKIQNDDYVLYPTDLDFTLYPDDGVLELEFKTYNWHSIGEGTKESMLELMQELYRDETYNERNEV